MSKTWGWGIFAAIVALVLLNSEIDWSPIYPFSTPLWVTAFYAGAVITLAFWTRESPHRAERGIFLFLSIFIGITLFQSALKPLGYWIPTGGWGGGNLLDALGIDLPEGRWVFLAIYVGGLLAGFVAIQSASGMRKAGLILLTVVFGLSLGPTALEVLHHRFPSWTSSSRQARSQLTIDQVNCGGHPTEIYVGAAYVDINRDGTCAPDLFGSQRPQHLWAKRAAWTGDKTEYLVAGTELPKDTEWIRADPPVTFGVKLSPPRYR